MSELWSFWPRESTAAVIIFSSKAIVVSEVGVRLARKNVIHLRVDSSFSLLRSLLCINRDQCETREQGPLPRSEIERSSGPAGNKTVVRRRDNVVRGGDGEDTIYAGIGFWRNLEKAVICGAGGVGGVASKVFREIGSLHRNLIFSEPFKNRPKKAIEFRVMAIALLRGHRPPTTDLVRRGIEVESLVMGERTYGMTMRIIRAQKQDSFKLVLVVYSRIHPQCN
jgi:hypothetical protein